eukprot:TRINITY_DN16274_c0_g1_i3.p1 TRINITY_DN16274_c0_g1~~TRINITY_DN16274_c0_g1_i3.p1  ORF type:complete len:263 (-),score=60.58 TRINITY_DN16274_c0_g1_i3:373-1161(-)
MCIRDRSIALYATHRKILDLVRRMPANAGIEEQVEWMVQTAMETGKLSAKKLRAGVATAVYLAHRLKHSHVLLSQIVKAYEVKCGDVSKCLTAFKSIGLYKEFDALGLWELYKQLVDCWFPYSSESYVAKAEPLDSAFSINPNVLAAKLFPTQNTVEEDKESNRRVSIREKLLDIGKAITELRDIDLAKQGKLPQGFAAGIFMIGTKMCNLRIPQKEVANKFDISNSTINQSKKEILEILSNNPAWNKWGEIEEYAKPMVKN